MEILRSGIFIFHSLVKYSYELNFARRRNNTKNVPNKMKSPQLYTSEIISGIYYIKAEAKTRAGAR